MARKQVVEVQCDRCTRIEHRTEDVRELPGEGSNPPRKTFQADLVVPHPEKASTNLLKRVEFEDLCGPCRSTVQQHLEQIGKKIDGMSPDRKKDKEEAETSPVPIVQRDTKPANSEAKKKGSDATPPPVLK